jgi:hypothetical protein
MIDKIEKIDDIKLFAKQIINEGVSFHPDDNFNDYVNLKSNAAIYTKEEAEKRNELMNQCFVLCDKEGFDIYEIMLSVTLVETGLDKLIPLPEQAN